MSFASPQENVLREDLETRHFRVAFLVFGAVRAAVADPGQDCLVVLGRFGKTHPAAMRDGHGRLLQNQALLGVLEIDARILDAGGLLSQDLEHTAFHDPLVVVLGMDSVGGQLESSLTFDSAMTPGWVAAAAGEDTDDIAREAEGPLLV